MRTVHPAPAPSSPEESRSLPSEALDAALDAYLGPEIVAEALRKEGSRWPTMAAAITRAVEERARELVNSERIEAEIERRANEIATRPSR